MRAGGGAQALAAAEALDAAATAGVPEPVVAGAVGFNPAAETGLVVPSVVRRADAPAGVRAPEAESGTSWTITPRPESARYAESVRRALELIGRGDLRKVVLARGLELTADAPVWVPALLARLVRADPAAYAFAVDVTAPGDPAPRTLVGASPELLVSRRGATVVANPLAGSAPGRATTRWTASGSRGCVNRPRTSANTPTPRPRWPRCSAGSVPTWTCPRGPR